MIVETLDRSISSMSQSPPGVSPTYINPRRKDPQASLSLRQIPAPAHIAGSLKSYATPPTLHHAPPNASLRPQRIFENTKTTKPTPYSTNDTQYISNDLRSGETSDKSPATSLESLQRSNPEDWFKSWNDNVGENDHITSQDDDPPYKIKKIFDSRRDSLHSDLALLSDTSLDLHNAAQMQIDESNLAVNSLFPFLPVETHIDDGFRGVIDDLTIKNQKLKRKLKKFERMHCEDLSENKLFEVRFHGLAPTKKQELEHLLQQFARTLDKNSPYMDESGASNQTLATKNHNVAAELSNTDSGYATESRGRTTTNSISPSNVNNVQRKPSPPSSSHPERNTLSNNLDNEKYKMKLVVRRVEELFTGRNASNPSNSVTKAQQLLSNMAAEDDRRALMNAGEQESDEGAREAALMSWMEDSEMMNASDENEKPSNAADRSTSSSPSRKQRPTRPVDLDPQRESIPYQNWEYLNRISHFQPDKHLHTKVFSENEASEWLYLNLVINMAQLHTFNVSLPFIKRSINEMSTSLELSLDEKKIRWKGGETGSKLNNDSENGDCSGSNYETSGGNISPDEAVVNLAHRSKDMDEDETGLRKPRTRSEHGVQSDRFSKFRYEPVVVVHGCSSRSESVSSGDSFNSSVPPSDISMVDAEECVGAWNNASGDGPITFFKGGQFCSDLSGQELPHEFVEGIALFDDSHYSRSNIQPIGTKRSCPVDIDPLEDHALEPPRALLKTARAETIDEDEFEDGHNPLLNFVSPPQSPLANPPSSPEPKALACSGLGGIRPEDNFMVKVVVRHTFACKGPRSGLKIKERQSLPKSALTVSHKHNAHATVSTSQRGSLRHEVVAINVTRLAPSCLPPPSYAAFSSSGESSISPLSSRGVKAITNDSSDRSYSGPIDLDSECPGDWNNYAEMEATDINRLHAAMQSNCGSVTQPMNDMMID